MHPKQINEIKDFLLITLRKDARSMKDQEEQGSCEVQGQMVEVSLHSQAISSSSRAIVVLHLNGKFVIQLQGMQLCASKDPPTIEMHSRRGSLWPPLVTTKSNAVMESRAKKR
ncbi:hypothetical protein KSP39_PZI000740 [Platanthera zijinensis]|uniref:Uncharacterized protein n=1 Tax=Platanthera zijinensis TaxID=2320716 RepID=A0AAP0C518_9ASPA